MDSEGRGTEEGIETEEMRGKGMEVKKKVWWRREKVPKECWRVLAEGWGIRIGLDSTPAPRRCR